MKNKNQAWKKNLKKNSVKRITKTSAIGIAIVGNKFKGDSFYFEK